MIRAYDKNCPLCRLMRSLAFTGVGFALGGGIAYLLGASRQDVILSGIVTAAILVFGIIGKKE